MAQQIILVPVDFSTNSQNAVDYAILVAKKLKAKILLLTVYHTTVLEALNDAYKVVTSKEIDGTPQESEEQLKLWRDAVRESEHEISCQEVFKYGDPANEIIKLAHEKKVKLIVMGTSGASGLKELFMGSNAAKVMEKVSCPVIAVPENYKYTEIKKIIFATDYHDNDITSIQLITQLAEKFEAELRIVHVATGEIKPTFEKDLLKDFQDEIEKVIRYPKIKFKLINDSDVHKALNEYIEKTNADLFSLAMRERLLPGPIFNRGLSKKFAYHIQIPLLVFHASDMGDSELL